MLRRICFNVCDTASGFLGAVPATWAWWFTSIWRRRLAGDLELLRGSATCDWVCFSGPCDDWLFWNRAVLLPSRLLDLGTSTVFFSFNPRTVELLLVFVAAAPRTYFLKFEAGAKEAFLDRFSGATAWLFLPWCSRLMCWLSCLIESGFFFLSTGMLFFGFRVL